MGVLLAVVGFFSLFDPIASLFALSILVGILLICEGVAAIVRPASPTGYGDKNACAALSAMYDVDDHLMIVFCFTHAMANVYSFTDESKVYTL